MKNILFALLAAVPGTSALAKEAKIADKISVEVTEKGFVPREINVNPGTEVTLEVTRKTDATCSKEIQVPSKKIRLELPLNEKVTVALGKLDKGEIRFGCGMNMMEGGKIISR